jgi:LacI family transcriptional regulator
MTQRGSAGDARKRVTIHEVAREAGVSLSTVSNALAGKDIVREDTRRIVREAAARLGYRASAVAQALRMRRTNTIGVLLADVANPSSPDIVRGIDDVAIREHCTLLLCNNDGDEARQIAQMRSLIDRQVDGIVLISQYSDSSAVREQFNTSVPFVLVQRHSAQFQDNYVGADNHASLVAVAEYLAGLGHRRIGYVCGPAVSSAVTERYAAFREAAARLDLDLDPSLVIAGDYGTEAGHRAANTLLNLRHPPTAIVASNDMSALGVLDVAAERDIDVPGQLSVIGYDDIALARLARIDLTTIHLPRREIGAAAATLLIEQIKAGPVRPAPRSILFPTRLVIRSTTGPAPRLHTNEPVKRARLSGSPRSV